MATLSIPRSAIEASRQRLADGDLSFVIQPHGHLTTSSYEYGITFIPEAYIRRTWSEFFEINRVDFGVVHDFQDIVVCRRA